MKDAKGHGSDAKGGASAVPAKKGKVDWTDRASVQAYHDRIFNALVHSDHLSPVGAYQAALQKTNVALRGFDSDKAAADKLAEGGAPGKGSVPVHPAQKDLDPNVNENGHTWGSPAALKDFTDKYGKPRDHAAEQRGFNSGKREINRLKRQGK